MISTGDTQVDVLVANWNTLPWMRLLTSQWKRVKASSSFIPHIWDDGSTDGSVDWLKNSGLSFYLSPDKVGHSSALHGLIDRTHAPYIALLDVDAVPVADGWMDGSISGVHGEGFGAAGLDGGHVAGRPFIHPSFCVFSRKLFKELKLSLDVVLSAGTLFDVGQFLCMQIQDAGYRLKMTGKARGNPWDEGFANKVYHFWGSTNILAYKNRSDVKDRESATWQKIRLAHYGLWNEFRAYAVETSAVNPNCKLYLG